MVPRGAQQTPAAVATGSAAAAGMEFVVAVVAAGTVKMVAAVAARAMKMAAAAVVGTVQVAD